MRKSPRRRSRHALAADLLKRYRALGLTPPTWSWSFPPSIPFIGPDYRPGGILVYGSAENLSHYERGANPIPAYMKDERARDRHRASYSNDNGFFPSIHIQPFNDGDLLVAVQYFLSKYGSPTVMHRDPEALLDRLVAANFSKFSIRSTTDRDIAGKRKKLEASIPFVTADLEVLKPGVIIIPRANWKVPSISSSVRMAAPNARVVALPQFTPSVANIHLRHHAAAAARLRASLRGSPIARWIENVPDYAEGYFYRFLIELDEEMRTMRG